MAGGLVRTNQAIEMSNRIERINIKNTIQGWQLLNVQMEDGGVDFGTIIRKDSSNNTEQLIIFGGWNKSPLQKVYVLSADDEELIHRVGFVEQDNQIEAMSNPDFFLVNGCSISDPQHGFDFILGNYNLFAFDHQKITFKKIDY